MTTIPIGKPITVDEPRHIIRTSDRRTYKKCRLQWDWTSKIRRDLEPNRIDKNLTFGTAIHAGLEQYYDPRSWHDRQVAIGAAHVAFDQSLPRPEAEADDEQRDAYKEALKLGHGMLDGYFAWATEYDRFTPLAVELEFEVPIPAPHGTSLPAPFGSNGEHLFYRGEHVMYQGRIDLLVQDEWGAYWICDHKTAGKLEDTDFLARDEQCGSYAWAIQEMLGFKINGVLYNELWKQLPHPPKQLKSGKFSVDKSQNTTLKIFQETVAQHGQDVVEYADFVEWLTANEKPYFRRTQVHRSQRELQLLGEQIALEAVDMLNGPSIYPNPDRFTCGRCAFQAPCLARMDGSDSEWLLKEIAHKRTPTNTTSSA